MSSKIITLPNQHLRQPSTKIGIITEDIIKIAEDMIKQAVRWEDERKHEVAVALAAIQIDQPFRIVIVREDFDDRDNRNFLTIVNPEISKYEGKVESDFEGCLSVKDFYARVPRHTKVRIKGLNLNGDEIKFKADGFLARVMQHEIDHTKGITIVDHNQDPNVDFKILTDEGNLHKVEADQVLAAGILAND